MVGVSHFDKIQQGNNIMTLLDLILRVFLGIISLFMIITGVSFIGSGVITLSPVLFFLGFAPVIIGSLMGLCALRTGR